MKALLTLALVSLVSSSALAANGWYCTSRSLNVRALDTSAAGAALILSNPNVGAGRKTIAKFTEANETLSASGNTYLARTDRRFNDSGRGGELVAGTRLKEVKTIRLSVPARSTDSSATGYVTVTKKDGKRTSLTLSCDRL